MSILGCYRHSGVTATSGAVTSSTVINISGFKPSGIDCGNLIGVALYCWSGSLANGYWMPLRREWL